MSVDRQQSEQAPPLPVPCTQFERIALPFQLFLQGISKRTFATYLHTKQFTKVDNLPEICKKSMGRKVKIQQGMGVHSLSLTSRSAEETDRLPRRNETGCVSTGDKPFFRETQHCPCSA